MDYDGKIELWMDDVCTYVSMYVSIDSWRMDG